MLHVRKMFPAAASRGKGITESRGCNGSMPDSFARAALGDGAAVPPSGASSSCKSFIKTCFTFF